MENQAFDRYVQSLYAQESLTPPAALESAIFARLDAVQPAARKRRMGWWMASVAGLVLAGWLVGTTWQAGEQAGAAGTAGAGAGAAGAGVGADGAGAGAAVGADVAAVAAVAAGADVAAAGADVAAGAAAGETATGVEVARGGAAVRPRTTSSSPSLVSTPVSSPVSNLSSQAAPCEPVRKLEVRPFQRTGRVGEQGLVYPRAEREVVAMPATITVRQ